MHHQTLTGYGAYHTAPQSYHQPFMGISELASPGIALQRHLSKPATGCCGLGVEPGAGAGAAAAGISIGLIAAVAVIAVAVNYQYGKAMAPKGKETKWAVTNAIAGTIFPPFTLGMALYKNYAT